MPHRFCGILSQQERQNNLRLLAPAPRQSAAQSTASNDRVPQPHTGAEKQMFRPPNSRPRTGHSNLWPERMKGKFDFARALVLVAFLPGDLDRGKPGLSSVDEIHTHRG
jgi:hypothetical protein